MSKAKKIDKSNPDITDVWEKGTILSPCIHHGDSPLSFTGMEELEKQWKKDEEELEELLKKEEEELKKQQREEEEVREKQQKKEEERRSRLSSRLREYFGKLIRRS